MSHKQVQSKLDVVFIALFSSLTILAVAVIYQGGLVDTAKHHRVIQRESHIASEPVGISRVQMQGVEQEIRACGLTQSLLLGNWHNRTSAESLVLEHERHCIDKMVRKVAIVDPDAAAALAYVIVEGPFNASDEVQAIARDDPQALQSVASLLAR